MKFNDKVYDVLKWICLIFLPAVQVLYLALDSIFDFGNSVSVIGVIAAVETFIGSLIGISSAYYYNENKKESEEIKDEEIC